MNAHYVPGNRNTMEKEALFLPSRSSQSYYLLHYKIKGNLKPGLYVQYGVSIDRTLRAQHTTTLPSYFFRD